MIKVHVYNRNELNNSEEFNLRVRQASDKRRPAFLNCKLSDKEWSNLCVSAVLDNALSEYGLSEKEAVISYGEQGKPYLKDYPYIYFNISHSGEYFVCAIGSVEMGIDIEKIDCKKNIIGIAKRFYAEDEIAYISEGKTDIERSRRFYRLWTCKESFVKSNGMSIVQEIENVRIAVNKEDIKVFYKDVIKDCSFEERIIDNYIMMVCSRND